MNMTLQMYTRSIIMTFTFNGKLHSQTRKANMPTSWINEVNI